jgi:hypothetical protein
MKAIVAIAVSVVIGFPALYLRHVVTHGELGSKPEWGTLQAAEAASREEPSVSQIVLREQHGFHLLGVPSRTTGKPVWVLLDPRAEPYYKQMPPNEDFTLTQQDIQQAAAYCTVHPNTIAQLQQRISTP